MLIVAMAERRRLLRLSGSHLRSLVLPWQAVFMRAGYLQPFWWN